MRFRRQSIRRGLLSLLVALAAVGSTASGQVVLQADDLGIITTQGFWLLPSNSPGGAPTNHVPATSFGGLAQLVKPAVAWEPGTDSFLVCTGALLFRVTILSSNSQSVTDLTPNLGGPARLTSLDIHPGTGALYLHDEQGALMFRLAQPFAAGMTPDLVLPIGPGVHALCLDSFDNPPSMFAVSSIHTSRVPLDGSAKIDVAFKGGTDIDGDPQHDQHALIANFATNTIIGTSDSPVVAQNLNISGLCAPLALGPVGVAYNPKSKRVYVLASGGLNPTCFPGGSDINQVVSLPSALNPMFPPIIITDPADSGITGSGGRLALVLDDYAFPSAYGFAAPSPVSGKTFALEAGSEPTIGINITLGFGMGPSLAPVFLLLGAQPISLPLPSGGTVLVLTGISPFFVGTTGANGKLTVTAALGPGIPAGLSAYLQGATKDAGHLILSNGLQLHFAP